MTEVSIYTEHRMAEGESLGPLPWRRDFNNFITLKIQFRKSFCSPTRAGRAPACGWPGTVHRMQIRVGGLEGQKHVFLSSRVAVAPRGGSDPLREPLRGPFPLAPMDFVTFTLTAGIMSLRQTTRVHQLYVSWGRGAHGGQTFYS